MGEIFKNMLEQARKQALAFANQNNLPPAICRIEITGGASKTHLLVNIMNEFCANNLTYTVGISIPIQTHVPLMFLLCSSYHFCLFVFHFFFIV